jgi:hypothetical protein
METSVQIKLDCECGKNFFVREADAGVLLRCQCGRSLEVPSLHELRRLAGLPPPGLRPEVVVETLLLAGKLPEEQHCVVCATPTEGVLCCTTECEWATVISGRPWWAYVLSFLTFGWVGALVLLATSRDEQEWGKDRIFPLPLRVCDHCKGRLNGTKERKAALSQVPIYRALLEKYPKARITVAAK